MDAPEPSEPVLDYNARRAAGSRHGVALIQINNRIICTIVPLMRAESRLSGVQAPCQAAILALTTKSATSITFATLQCMRVITSAGSGNSTRDWQPGFRFLRFEVTQQLRRST